MGDQFEGYNRITEEFYSLAGDDMEDDVLGRMVSYCISERRLELEGG